jgi:hypothetical protein
MKQSVWRALVAGVSVWLLMASAIHIAAPAEAADVRTAHATSPAPALPFSRGERAQAVWASSACFRDCGAYCAWGQTSCLYRDSQGRCLKLTDGCDRYCQRACRTSGGPWLPLDF